MLLEMDFADRPEARVSKHFESEALVRREMFSALHGVLEESAEKSPPEAVELGFTFGGDDFVSIDADHPWEWNWGRVKIRISVD